MISERFEKNARETQTAFAAAVVLLNLLILTVTAGVIWFLLSLMSAESPFTAILREAALR
jgi:hypothetical protein